MRILLALMLAATAAAAQESAVAQLTGPFSHSQYPMELGDRPLVLPNLMLEGTTQFEYVKIGPSSTTSGIGLRAALGIGDVAQIDLNSSIFVDPESKWSKVLFARAGFLAYDSRQLDIAPSLLVPLDFNSNADLLSGAMVGAETRFRIDNLIYVYGLRDLLLLGWGTAYNDELSAEINGTVGVGIEPMHHVSLELDATLFRIKVAGKGDASRLIFSDEIPVAAKALFAINRQFDIVAQLIAPDLKNGFDSLTFVGGLNARL
ncbi:MAG TPA: hypothetical protein VLW85_12315 [Myxococcales bacterium]|nr:hypothetical protein [Myxococcales bacterium]